MLRTQHCYFQPYYHVILLEQILLNLPIMFEVNLTLPKVCHLLKVV